MLGDDYRPGLRPWMNCNITIFLSAKVWRLRYNPASMNNKLIIIITISLMTVATVAGIYTARQQQHALSQPDIAGLLWPNPKQLHAFSTLDHEGQVFGLEKLQGKWSFLFFGFTHCPDICPITLSVLNEVKTLIEKDGQHGDTQVVFVSIDPERDTPAQLAAYVDYFNKDFIGLGGSQAQIQSLAGQIGVMYFRGETSATGDYLMDHSASAFLIDPRGRLIGVFSAPHAAADVAARFMQIKAFIEGQI